MLLGRGWAEDDGMSVATVTVQSQPDRHALVLLDCECGTCPPTWARRRGKSRRFTEPVTLVAALEREDAAACPGMVERRRESLEELTGAADRLIAMTARDDPARPGVGLSLLMLAAELAWRCGRMSTGVTCRLAWWRRASRRSLRRRWPPRPA